MTPAVEPRWTTSRTDETRMVEGVLREAGFDRVDAYRYNLASIRVRVVDRRFEGLSHMQRDDMVEPFLDQLPEHTQSDIISLFAFAPSDLLASPQSSNQSRANMEFDDPSPSML